MGSSAAHTARVGSGMSGEWAEVVVRFHRADGQVINMEFPRLEFRSSTDGITLDTEIEEHDEERYSGGITWTPPPTAGHLKLTVEAPMDIGTSDPTYVMWTCEEPGPGIPVGPPGATFDGAKARVDAFQALVDRSGKAPE